jgi:hypothetical protein
MGIAETSPCDLAKHFIWTSQREMVQRQCGAGGEKAGIAMIHSHFSTEVEAFHGYFFPAPTPEGINLPQGLPAGIEQRIT